MEGGAGELAALRPHAAAVELDELARDGQPETAAALVHVHGRLQPHEGAEDAAQVLLADADAGVVHGQVQTARLLSRAHHHAAVRGELHGVREQVEQDLAHGEPVALRGDDVGSDLGLDDQRLAAGQDAGGVQTLLDEGLQVEDLELHVQTPGLQPRGLEHGVDELQQIGAALLDGAHEARMLRVQPAVVLQHDLGEAEDRVERRAQLVGDAGHEARLEAVRLTRRALASRRSCARRATSCSRRPASSTSISSRSWRP